MMGTDVSRSQIERIIEVSARYFNVQPKVLTRVGMRAKLTDEARCIAMYMAKEVIGASHTEIGRAFGQRDRSTVMRSVKWVLEHKNNPRVAKIIEELSVLCSNA